MPVAVFGDVMAVVLLPIRNPPLTAGWVTLPELIVKVPLMVFAEEAFAKIKL